MVDSAGLDRSHILGRRPVADHAEIIRAAWQLFEKNGYEATTMTDIAQVAGISRRSLFNYFDTKEALLYPNVDSFFDAFKVELAKRPVDEPLIDSCSISLTNLKALTEQIEAELDPPAEVKQARLSEPAVRYTRDMWAKAMTEVLADRIGSDSQADIKASFVAALVAQIWTEATKIARDSKGKLSPHQAIDRVLKSLRELFR
mgnify:CR=1 FL=1